MNTEKRIKKITKWIKNYAEDNNIQSLVVGVSGGIDSAVVSTLCAKTGIQTYAVSIPIKQNIELHSRSQKHLDWLDDEYGNVITITLDLTDTFKSFSKQMTKEFSSELAFANSKSRLRMMTLYQIAQSTNGIVVGTGNKIEDFGVGFFTKYGDGGVDISPIADCMKCEVWAMGNALGVSKEIINAPPTDGLWDDGRTDEDQLGMSYAALERAMRMDENKIKPSTKQDKQNLKRYKSIRAKNLHKMTPIPICYMKK